ncbi:hypothetical protein L292_2098 [Acinetobacter junii CIP 107470 = MTCC 11364]|uniref:Uncharacterized protein n=1 Tax=Acinetobacter junii CIP 107470 = MTCC 11364 TaxID=1217666 RepID=S7Y6S3_ACIJU|nr:hypothetical protein [Acinetobacter junii]ENV52088.1 hypothetical protein F953_00500 [Acinetobacter junii CIP 107470 = MTCC 11364]EPR86864.1 hypothetical protein L292_2098 [Acinetobacter junii CIP 107470 = MTCC 11364]
MTVQRLAKDTVSLIKNSVKVVFVRKRYESGRQQVVILIYLSEDAFPLVASAAEKNNDWGRYWDAHDIPKAKRSIRRLNKECLIIDRRDFIWQEVEDLKTFKV